MNLHFLRIT